MSRPDDHDARIARALHSLEGLAVGDAFGEQGLAGLAILERLQRRRPIEGRWPYTDDTVMAMSIVEVLQHHGHIEQDALAQRFADKFQVDPMRGYGGTAVTILWEIARGQNWRRVARAAFGGLGSMGNGGAMRAAPIGAYFADDLPRAAAEARRSAEVTHAHPEGQAGAMAVAAAAAWMARRPFDGAGLFDAVLDVVPPGPTRDGIAAAAGLAGHTDIDVVVGRLGNGMKVLAQDTVPFALWCARHHANDYAEALWTVVSRFGDADTLAAIVGGIVALAPDTAIPEDWRQHREPLSMFLRLDEENPGGRGPPRLRQRAQRSATAPPGRFERLGAWGPSRGPHLQK
jgi:ADP-ribosylglycohydrolase